jgi:hypothetical protein
MPQGEGLWSSLKDWIRGGSNACEKSFKSSEEGVAASELASDMRPDASKCAIQGRGASEPAANP